MSTLSSGLPSVVCFGAETCLRVSRLAMASRSFTRFCLSFPTPAVCPDGPIVIVVSPLRSLMRDQVLSLQGNGTRAFQVGWCVQDDDCIKNGDCSVFFGTSEVLLGTEEWRSSLQTSQLKDRLIAIAVDEVHTVKPGSQY